MTTLSRFSSWLEDPVPVIRMEAIRIFTPLFVLGFMSRRFAHADEWIGSAGFRVPDLGVADTRQPLFVPGLPDWAAWSIALLLVGSGVAVALGVRTRASALAFAATLGFVALSDRLAAFTVSKISPVLMVAVAVGPAGKRLGVDAWLARKAGGKKSKKLRRNGGLRFVQLFLPIFYSSSGLAKALGDWLHTPHLLWTHLHDTYQTAASFWIASVMPVWGYDVLQGAVLAFELFAPLWLGVKRLRPYGVVFGVGMHFFIGIMFGPVVWFSALMATLLVGAYAPLSIFGPLERLAVRLEVAPRHRGEDQGATQTT